MSPPSGDAADLDERALLARIAEGDERALEDLYRRFEPRIMAFAQTIERSGCRLRHPQ